MLAAQKACSSINKTAITQCLRRHFVETSSVSSGGSNELGPGGGGGTDQQPPTPQQKPVVDETLDRRDEAHDKPWRDGISGITHLYDMEEAKSLQQ